MAPVTQSPTLGTCERESKPAIAPIGVCPIQERKKRPAVLYPEQLPLCGRQGQTLPSLDPSDNVVDEVKDEDKVEIKAILDESYDASLSHCPRKPSENIPDVNKILGDVATTENSTFIPAQEADLTKSISIVPALADSCDAPQEVQKKPKKAIKIPTQQEIEESKIIELRLLEGTIRRPEAEQTTGKACQYDTPVHETLQEAINEAKEKFKSAAPINILTIDKGECGDLPDGRRIGWRYTSSAKIPTVEIHNLKNDRKIKIRFPNKESKK